VLVRVAERVWLEEKTVQATALCRVVALQRPERIFKHRAQGGNHLLVRLVRSVSGTMADMVEYH